MAINEFGTVASAGRDTDVTEIWFTRCPVPTATGIAADLGWFIREFEPDGITVSSLQDQPSGPLASQHFEHGLFTLFREGGNVPALWTRSRGQATRLIGLTWIDECQAIVVRADSDIDHAQALKGRRVALPVRGNRSVDFWRAMALHGFSGALESTGLTLADVTPVDVTTALSEDDRGNTANRANSWQPELDTLIVGDVDAVYLKGAAAVEAGRAAGARVAIDLDTIDDRRFRVNNGTPRPITVHQELLDARPDLVSRFLSILLEAANWAAKHPTELGLILQSETGSGSEGVAGAYRNDFHLSLHPDLSDERLQLLVQQKDFLLEHAFLEGDVDIHKWAAREPLRDAWALLDARTT